MNARSGSASNMQWFLGALLVLVVVAALGWWLGRAGPLARVAELEGGLAQMQARAEAAERDHGHALAKSALLQVQVSLMQAAIELDQRNFGIANGHVAAARQALATLDAAALGVDANQLDELEAALDDTDLAVATDFGAQRQVLVDLVARVQALAPRP